MSRTYAFSTPTRRSRRLLQNGYYRVESGEQANLLDLPASDEDDTTSIDSNVSKASDQRNISYKESPPHRLFHSKRKQLSRSPHRQISSSLLDLPMQRAAYEAVSYSESQLHRLTQKNYSSATHSDQDMVDISIASSYKTRRQDTSDVRKVHVSSTSRTKSREIQRRKFAQQSHDGADGDSGFKVPTIKKSIGNSSKSRIKVSCFQINLF